VGDATWSLLRGVRGDSAPDEIPNCLSDVSRTGVVERADRPSDTIIARRPNPKYRLPPGQVEPKHRREARMRRTYDMNKELADDLRTSYTVVVGSATIWTPSGQVIWKEKKRSR
jgi:hypothetical protein